MTLYNCLVYITLRYLVLNYKQNIPQVIRIAGGV